MHVYPGRYLVVGWSLALQSWSLALSSLPRPRLQHNLMVRVRLKYTHNVTCVILSLAVRGLVASSRVLGVSLQVAMALA